MDNLLGKLAHEIKGDATKMGVADQIIEIEGEKLKHKAEVVSMLEVALQSH